MALINVDIEKLEEALQWINGDIEDFEKLLSYCGKGDAGDYEHFFLTLAIYHLNEAGNYMQKLVANYEERVGKTSTSTDLVPATTLVKIEGSENAYEYSDTPYSTTNDTTDPKKDGDLKIIDALIREVIEEFPDRVQGHKDGERGNLGFLTAQVVIRTNAKANTGTVFELLENALETA